jgi:hypothetical protein
MKINRCPTCNKEIEPYESEDLEVMYDGEITLEAAIELLQQCVDYIETTWGEEDDLPEPWCSEAARGFIAIATAKDIV